MDKFIVRLITIIVNLYVVVVLLFALQGIDISNNDYLFSNTLPLGLLLTVLAHSQGKYHCKWIRGLCYNCISMPLFCYIDSKYILFENAIEYVYAIAILWSIGVLYTITLSIFHFRKVRKVVNDKKNLHVTE